MEPFAYTLIPAINSTVMADVDSLGDVIERDYRKHVLSAKIEGREPLIYAAFEAQWMGNDYEAGIFED